MVEQTSADVRNVGWSLRQKEILRIVQDAIQSLRSRARAFFRSSFIVVAIIDIKRVRALEAYMGYDEEAQDEAMEISDYACAHKTWL